MNYGKKKNEIKFQRGANIFFTPLGFFRLWDVFINSFFCFVLVSVLLMEKKSNLNFSFWGKIWNSGD